MIHRVGFMMLGKITRVGGAEAVMHRERLEKIQAGIAKRVLPKHREPVFLNLPVVDQSAMKIRQARHSGSIGESRTSSLVSPSAAPVLIKSCICPGGLGWPNSSRT